MSLASPCANQPFLGPEFRKASQESPFHTDKQWSMVINNGKHWNISYGNLTRPIRFDLRRLGVMLAARVPRLLAALHSMTREDYWVPGFVWFCMVLSYSFRVFSDFA